MMMSQPFNHRVEKVLNKLLEPNFKPKDDSYFNLLLTHLTSISNDSKDAFYQQEANKQLLLQWMKQSISYWEETKIMSNADTYTFILNLMGYLSRDEQTFLEINNENMYERLLAVIISRFQYSGIQPSIKLAYIKLYSSLLNHALGLQWIISNKRWQLIMEYSLKPSTVYISKGGYEFMASLLEKSVKFDLVEAKKILRIILLPLMDAGTNKVGFTTVTNEEGLHKSVSLILPLLTKMLEIFMESKNQVNIQDIVMVLEEDFKFDEILRTLNTSMKEGDFDLYKINIIWNFLIVYVKYGVKPVIFYEKIEKQLLGIFYDATSRLNVVDMLKLLHLSLIYWNNVKSKIPPTSDSNSESEKSLEKQLLVLQIFPVHAVKKVEENEEDHIRSLCFHKFFDQISPHNLRVRYKWKKYLKEEYSFTDGILALKYVLHSQKYYIRENAVMAFQLLVYVVQDITNLLNTRPDFIHAFSNQPDFVILLIECIKVIVDEFTITWKDSVESLCIIQAMHALMSVTAWPPKIVISCLQLIEKALVKYMTPEMALLVDTTEESSIYHVLSILTTKLHDSDWEIRDSAIELIRTITVSTYTKFSSLGKIVLEHDFPNSILQMGTIDGNSFVRATSLKCLQEMVKVNEFWDVLKHEGHILERAPRILYVDQEGIVRTEAAALIDSIYKNHELPESTVSNFYDIMHHAVIADLHWETRVNALKFWKNVIDKHLTQQGMIDGEFPKFVFSKERHKIIDLTTAQVKTRLIEVLEQLSQIGCLSAFQFALKDDCDLEVTKYATTSMTAFSSLLKKYNIATSDVSSMNLESNSSNQIPQSDSAKSRPSTGSEDDTKYSSYSSFNENVMDEVLDSLDANLLESIFNFHDQPPDDNVEMQSRKLVSPKEFLESVYSDIAHSVEQKSNWIDGIDNFNSLLDDILKEYEVNDVNEMDCY